MDWGMGGGSCRALIAVIQINLVPESCLSQASTLGDIPFNRTATFSRVTIDLIWELLMFQFKAGLQSKAM